ncbi:MAG: YraN family protein [Oscillospiraceae bacterium]
MKSCNNNDYKKRIGNLGEVAICHYISDLGYEVVCRNYAINGGEIDIIACDNEYILFIEVKTRNFNSLTTGFQAITKTKKRCILKTASRFCIDNVIKLQPRFDVAEVVIDSLEKVMDIQYYPNAFDTTNMGIYIPIY